MGIKKFHEGILQALRPLFKRCLLWSKIGKKQASGGKGGEATLCKNTLKAGCECALPLVPRVKSHPPLRRNSFKNNFEDLFIKLFKSLAPGRAAGGIAE